MFTLPQNWFKVVILISFYFNYQILAFAQDSYKHMGTNKLKLFEDDKCPPCFNCMLPLFECKQFSTCNEFSGRCDCIDGFGGDDCSVPLCGSLSLDNDHRPLRNMTENESCDCEDGWGGINCNICQLDSACDKFMPDKSVKGTCYKQGMIVNKLYQGCNVTNKKIIEVLKGAIPQVTFSCDKKPDNCGFQFWIDQIESFYCSLDTCDFQFDLNTNSSHYKCENAKCKCIPGTMLCGKDGSIDISEFLTETIKGPGDFSCDLSSRNCKFSEPSMNDLISSIFGDAYITLNCESGECLHYSEIPGYQLPSNGGGMDWRSKFILSVTSTSMIVFVIFAVFNISKSPFFKKKSIQLPEEDNLLNETDINNNFLNSDKLATLTFEKISYSVLTKNEKKERHLLESVSGMVEPGEILAIMGGSGAGKTTLLDILAKKKKVGHTTGTLRLNGNLISDKEYGKMIGFVDQENYLLPTLTVYETVLNSALLRLPRIMSFEAKQLRVLQVLEELRIYDIKDCLIGNEYERGISGGEKRRVSIACELVTSPLILFLDEPTSGLDANNANNVVECLVRLARNHKRTLVFSIHQPRSNIFHLFNKLVLLSRGKMVYSGEAIQVTNFLKNCGLQCPVGYNIADYLIDVTFEPQQQLIDVSSNSNIHDPENIQEASSDDSSPNKIGRSTTQREWEHFAVHRDQLRTLLKDKPNANAEINADSEYSSLQTKFEESQFCQELLTNITAFNGSRQERVELTNTYGAASFFEQFLILCSRTFKNVYRNPKLLIGNYLLTVVLGLFLGTLYYNITNDISGFQNRMGLFFFILTYFGLITFTGLSSFAVERIIFIKERANNYYTPSAYFCSKIVSDIIPLRVIPPILLSLIVYPMAGLNMENDGFLKFVAILILFNLGISLEILSIGIIFTDLNNSIILSVLVLLASLLFSGLFINTLDITNAAFKYLKNISIFYYAYESLLINEVKTLMLREKKYGLNIEVPGATILSTFGFKVQNLIFDVKLLIMFNITFLIMGFLALKFIVKEKK